MMRVVYIFVISDTSLRNNTVNTDEPNKSLRVLNDGVTRSQDPHETRHHMCQLRTKRRALTWIKIN